MKILVERCRKGMKTETNQCKVLQLMSCIWYYDHGDRSEALKGMMEDVLDGPKEDT